MVRTSTRIMIERHHDLLAQTSFSFLADFNSRRARPFFSFLLCLALFFAPFLSFLLSFFDVLSMYSLIWQLVLSLSLSLSFS